jgi:hypothetical protein
VTPVGPRPAAAEPSYPAGQPVAAPLHDVPSAERTRLRADGVTLHAVTAGDPADPSSSSSTASPSSGTAGAPTSSPS